MEKLISNRVYLDYNATSPLAQSVKDWIPKGDSLFANPSSIHQQGKKSKRMLKETSEFLLRYFNLNDNFQVIYHSGATEGINAIIQGFALRGKIHQEEIHVFVAKTDHSCAYNMEQRITLLGGSLHFYEVDNNGEIDLKELIESIKKCSGKVLVNFTYVNNETGVVNHLDQAQKIKSETNAYIHVDAVQCVGKIKDFDKLNSDLDFYTFSGHKFGALKGVGLSFMKKGLCLPPLIIGGGQQENRRSGTENVTGIYSLMLALKEVDAVNLTNLAQAQKFLEDSIFQLSDGKVQVVGKNAAYRSLGTSYLIFPKAKADILLTAFDLAGIDVSTGSACSSAAVAPSRVLLAMGYSEEDSKRGIRLSYSPHMDKKMAQDIWAKISKVIERFI